MSHSLAYTLYCCTFCTCKNIILDSFQLEQYTINLSLIVSQLIDLDWIGQWDLDIVL